MTRSFSVFPVLVFLGACAAEPMVDSMDSGATNVDAAHDSGSRDAGLFDASRMDATATDAGEDASTDARMPTDAAADADETDATLIVVDGGTVVTPVYYVHEDGFSLRLYREFRRVPFTFDPVYAAVDAMLHTPPLDPDYDSLWPDGTSINRIETSGSTCTVDLSSDALTPVLGAEAEGISLQQLVYTVTAANNAVTSVELLIDGEEVESLWGHVDTTGPMTRAPRIEVLGAIWIIDPQHGEEVTTLNVSGDATVFEATLHWSIERACAIPGCSDTPFSDEGFTMTDDGAPSRGLWSVNIPIPSVAYDGDGLVRISAWEISAKDGSTLHLDDKIISLIP